MNAEKTFSVLQDDAPDLCFSGVLLAELSNAPADFDMDRCTHEWLELSLYRTTGGKLVCSRATCTMQPDPDRYEARICTDDAGVVAFFGYGKLSKELYDLAGIDADLRVD